MHTGADSDNEVTAPSFKNPSAGHGYRLRPPGRRSISWVRGWQLALVAALGAVGCGTTRVTDTQRTATEQLLVSNAVDQAVSQLDFRILAGKPVYFDPQYLVGSIDRGYVVSSLRQHLLASGCILQEDRAQATYVVEARSGGIGTDRHQVLIGVPEMNAPSLLPGQPTLIPEIPLVKRTDQRGVAKLAVFAYNRRTGRPVWQLGVVRMVSTSKDTWLLGAGPFRRGTIGDGTEFAGQPLPIPQIPFPLLRGKEQGSEAGAEGAERETSRAHANGRANPAPAKALGHPVPSRSDCCSSVWSTGAKVSLGRLNGYFLLSGKTFERRSLSANASPFIAQPDVRSRS
jgi:hypothetical protein